MVFAPLDGRAQWRVIYDRLEYMNIGDVVTYEELIELLPNASPASVRLAFFRAAKGILHNHKRAFECIRTVGYQMVHPNEQERLARKREARSKRQVRGARDLVTKVDYNLVAPDVRRRMADLEHHYRSLDSMMRGIAQRQARMEERQASLEQRSAATEKGSGIVADRIDRLKTILRAGGYLTDKEAEEI